MTDAMPVVLMERSFSWRRISTVVLLVIFGTTAVVTWKVMIPPLLRYFVFERVEPLPEDAPPRFVIDLFAGLLTVVSLYVGVGSTKSVFKMLWFFVTAHVDRQLITSEGLEVRLIINKYCYSWRDIVAVSMGGRLGSNGYEVCIEHRKWASRKIPFMNIWVSRKVPFMNIRIDQGLTEAEAIEFLRLLRKHVRPTPVIKYNDCAPHENPCAF